MPEHPVAEYGPFASEAEVRATRTAARIRAAYDANPGIGASFPEALKVMTEACEEAGVILGDYDLGLLRWLSKGETGTAVALAGIIHRAFEAGKAADPESTVTEWGVRYRIHRRYEDACEGEDDARADVAHLQAGHPEWSPVLIKRTAGRAAGPWEEVPGA